MGSVPRKKVPPTASRRLEEKASQRREHLIELDDGLTETLDEFSFSFSDLRRFDHRLELLTDLNMFKEKDEKMLLLIKVC